MNGPLIEVLTFESCANAQAAVDLVTSVVAELGLAADVRHVEVADLEAATTNRFLGSPTIRVDGRDVEPGADDRSAFALSCRVYRTTSGVAGVPDERWLRQALAGAASRSRRDT